VNILQYCLLKHSGRTPAQLGIFDEHTGTAARRRRDRQRGRGRPAGSQVSTGARKCAVPPPDGQGWQTTEQVNQRELPHVRPNPTRAR
jgi:hypothetical protein